MTKEEWFDLPKLNMFDKDFKEKELDEEMALGLLNELQVNWCGRHCDNYRKNSCGCYFPKFKEQMILKIKDHFKSKENTLEFKNFKLHANGNLKNMSKDELINYIHMLHHNWSISNEQLFNVDELDAIKNLKPYRFEDLKEGMWVWDDEEQKLTKILEVYATDENYNVYAKNVPIVKHGLHKFGWSYSVFKEGRFYPIIKALEYQK